MQKKILLINPHTDNVTYEPPLGILYLGAVLERRGHTIKIIDADIDNLSRQQVEKHVRKFSPNVVGITCNTSQVIEAFNLARITKSVEENITTIIGGPHPTALPTQTLKECPYIDFLVIGEGEKTMVELVEEMENNEGLRKIKGIAYRNGEQINVNSPRPFIKDLDSLPFPAHHLNEPLERYTMFPCVPVLPSRGCPFQCLFCSNPVWGKTYRRRSPQNVVDEVEHLINKYNVKEIDFHDDIFNLDPNFVMDLCDELIYRKLHKKIKWRAECRVGKELVTEKLLSKMKESGCCLVSFGVESGNQKILDGINKKITLDEVRRAFKLAKQVGLKTRGFFMIGNLGEDVSTVYDTIKFAKELSPDISQFNFAIPFPGSKFYDIATQKKLIKTFNLSIYRYRFYRHRFEIPPVIEQSKLSKRDMIFLRVIALLECRSIYSTTESSRMRPKLFLSNLFRLLRSVYRDQLYRPAFLRRYFGFKLYERGYKLQV